MNNHSPIPPKQVQPLNSRDVEYELKDLKREIGRTQSRVAELLGRLESLDARIKLVSDGRQTEGGP